MKKKWQFSNVLSWPKKKPQGRIGLFLSEQGLALAHLDAQGKVQSCQYHPLDEVSAETVMRGLVSANHWQDMPCALLLEPKLYHFSLMQLPQVPDSELASALRWQCRELLDYPVENAAVEYFKLPEDAYQGRQKMAYVAAVDKEKLTELANLVEGCELALDSVQIAELANHQLMKNCSEEMGGVALLALGQTAGILNLCEGQQVYFTRSVEIPRNLEGEINLDGLLLEVQRSLDYYERQLGKGVIVKLYCITMDKNKQTVMDYFSTNLGIQVNALEIDSLMAESAALDTEWLPHCGGAIGAALSAMQITSAEQENNERVSHAAN